MFLAFRLYGNVATPFLLWEENEVTSDVVKMNNTVLLFNLAFQTPFFTKDIFNVVVGNILHLR